MTQGAKCKAQRRKGTWRSGYQVSAKCASYNCLAFALCVLRLCVESMRVAPPADVDVADHAPHPAPAPVRREPVRLSGAQPAERGDLGRRESEPGQGLQLRLHLLPGRSHDAERDAVRRDRAAAGGAGRHAASWSASGELFEHREVPRHAAAAPPAERHRLLRRRRADDVPQLRRDHRRLRRAEAAAGARRREDGADHQRQHVPPPARPARAGDPRPEQRRNLGQARSGHRRVFPARRSHADSVPADSGQHHGRGASPAAGDSGPVHARPRRAAERGGAGRRSATG